MIEFVVLYDEGEIIAGVFVAHNPSPDRFMELNSSSLTGLLDRAVRSSPRGTSFIVALLKRAFVQATLTLWRQANTWSSGTFLACVSACLARSVFMREAGQAKMLEFISLEIRS